MRGFSSTGHHYVPVSGLPSTQSGVEAIQNRVAGLMTAAEDQDYSFFIQQQIGRLTDLLKMCEESEQQLLRFYGVSSVHELNEKIKILLTNTGLEQLSAINFKSFFKEIKDRIDLIATQELEDFLNSGILGQEIFHDPTMVGKVRDTAGSIFGSFLGVSFGRIAGANGINPKSSLRGYQKAYLKDAAGNKTVKMGGAQGDTILLTIDNYWRIIQTSLGNNKFSYRFEHIMNTTSWMRKRLLLGIKSYLDGGAARLDISNAEMRELLNKNNINALSQGLKMDFPSFIRKQLDAIDMPADLKMIYADEILNNFDKYALSDNVSSMKGFMGELQFNILLRRLFPGASSTALSSLGKVIPTGNMLDTTGKQFGIDTVLKTALGQFNFQVKNYSTVFNSSGGLDTWEYKGQSTMDGFLGRAGLGGATGDLNKFFASWGFNTPFKADPGTTWPGSYPGTFARFGEIAGKLDQVFLSYADKIIRVDQLFQAQSDDLNLFPKGLYFNTMFFIGQTLVPSSAILRGMINHFQNINTKGVITFESEMTRNNEGKQVGDTLYGVIHKFRKIPNPPTYSADIGNAAKNIFIKYKVIINLETIMSSLATVKI